MKSRDRSKELDSPGKRVTYARIKRNMTQQQLADKAEMAQSTLASLESGRNQGSKKIIDIAHALGVPAEWLAKGVLRTKSKQGQLENPLFSDLACLETPIQRVNHAAKNKDIDISELSMITGISTISAETLEPRSHSFSKLIRTISEILEIPFALLAYGQLDEHDANRVKEEKENSALNNAEIGLSDSSMSYISLLGKNIEKARKRRSITPSSLCTLSNISTAEYKLIIEGDSSSTLLSIMSAAQSLEIEHLFPVMFNPDLDTVGMSLEKSKYDRDPEP